MAEITAQMVKDLREATGAGPLDCKKALEQNNGDFQKAADYLREKGLAKAAKKLSSDRAMNEGLIETYQHFNKRLGVMVEVNCETDFVAATEQFKQFCKDVALQVANLSAQYLRREDVPEAVVAAEREMQKRILMEDPKNSSKPEAILEKIIEGRMNSFFEEIVLMEQKFIKDDSKTMQQLLQEVVASIGERVEVRRFVRFALGQGKAAAEEE